MFSSLFSSSSKDSKNDSSANQQSHPSTDLPKQSSEHGHSISAPQRKTIFTTSIPVNSKINVEVNVQKVGKKIK